MTDQQTAELVAKRLEGKKPFLALARETVFYEVEIWAANEDEAMDIARNDVEDWGDIVDGEDFSIYDIVEVNKQL